MCVASTAMPAASFAPSALPPLKPNQPTPQHARAGHCQRQVVRRHGHVREAAASADHQRAHERRHAGIHVHDDATRVVHDTQLREPAAAPHPVRTGTYTSISHSALNHSTTLKRMRSA